jgi:beta-glucanase (GH16 family)
MASGDTATGGRRTLVWADEFDGPAGAPPDPASWTAEAGGDGWGNGELQSYTGATANARLDGRGNLEIVARAESGRADGCRYSSARLVTQGKVEVGCGEIEARVRLPRGRGMWPAVWMLGADLPGVAWPGCGEIDVMENLGHDPFTVHGTVHGPGYSGRHGVSGSWVAAADLSAAFHVYAVRWRPDGIDWLLDGRRYHRVTPETVPGDWVFDHPFFLLINLAVGGDWPGAPDAETRFPQSLLVDYLRVYRA